VHLLLPIATEPVASRAPAQPVERSGGATILVVDDEPIVRSSVRRALTRAGYRVLEAEDAPAAQRQLLGAQPPVDLVILDLVLPGGGAGIFEVLKALRPDLKVLVSSGYTPDADIARAVVARADGFLAKPYELSELRAAVARALSRAAA